MFKNIYDSFKDKKLAKWYIFHCILFFICFSCFLGFIFGGCGVGAAICGLLGGHCYIFVHMISDVESENHKGGL